MSFAAERRTMPARIEDYALIGDCQTAALVARDGSIDWLCWPRFDSAACFAALLGDARHGRWQLAPAMVNGSTLQAVRRRYRPDTLILETDFETANGTVTVTDFMPLDTEHSHIVRLVTGRSGRVDMRMDLVLRFDYGSSVPWVSRLPGEPGLRAVAGPDMVTLRTVVPMHGHDMRTVASFSVSAGETLPFVLTYCPSHRPVPASIDPLASLDATALVWHRWAARGTQAGEWSEAVSRSLITLKALTYGPTGGIVAAPTTSLPERPKGVRNWDYRYCWLRDATLTLLALMNGGYYEEADAWRAWLQRAVAGSPAQAQIMYGIGGERRLPEWTIPWLPGYEGAVPVRIGNAAVSQLQLDVYGELMDALHQARKSGLATDENSWAVQRALVAQLSKVWDRPDHGMWEVRGPGQQFTSSKVMAWVAVDRAVKAVEGFGLAGPVEEWRKLRDRIHADVCARAYDPARRSFVQSYGSSQLDASLLMIPLTGFLPVGDPRVAGTVEAIRRELTIDGLVARYRTERTDDGLPPGEGLFLACSFWLADCLALMGRLDEAAELFERLLALRNDVGLLSEEYDPVARRLVGNFPQAFSHVGIVNTALNLSHAANPAKQRGEEQTRLAG